LAEEQKEPHFAIEPLGEKHNRAAFSCGVEALDSYLHKQAGQDAAGIAVILHHQYLQGHNSGKNSRGHECLAQLSQSKWPRHLVASRREKSWRSQTGVWEREPRLG